MKKKILVVFPFNLFMLFYGACKQRGLSMAAVIRILVEKWLFEIGALSTFEKDIDEDASLSNINRNAHYKRGIDDI